MMNRNQTQVLKLSVLAAGLLATFSASALTVATQKKAVQKVLAMPTCSYVSQSDPASFYWEIGNANGVVYKSASATPRTAAINIASASKWPFGAWYVQQHGLPSGYDLYRLTQTSHMQATGLGSTFSGGAYVIVCDPAGTVGKCAAASTTNPTNDQTQTAFSYDEAHFQSLAADDTTLAAEHDAALGTSISTGDLMASTGFKYWEPSLGGGIKVTPASYASFLQLLLKGAAGTPGGLALGGDLDIGLACATNPSLGNPDPTQQNPVQWLAPLSPNGSAAALCPAGTGAGSSQNSPFPYEEAAQYGIAHWKEFDGTYSSPGAFGFYPWVDTQADLYGIVSVAVTPSVTYPDAPSTDSMYCGRNIRNAWMSGVARDPYTNFFQTN